MEPAHRHTILKRMASLIAADGLLVLDPAEHLGESQHLFGPARSGIYTARFERIGIP
jgi:chemotaxis methyl-accepting protein methylase